jgi:hypothetical protein
MPTLQSVGIEEIGFWVEQYRIEWKPAGPVREQGFSTKLYAWYRTKDNSSLRDFVFVQFIQGCTFETRKINGAIAVSQPRVRTFFGKQGVSFNHRSWVIDSVDTDPAYWSDPEYLDRHAWLRWGINDDSFPHRPQDYPTVAEGPPSEPRVFITDIPDGGDIRWNPWSKTLIATNSTFQFKTCLFRTQDVPAQASPDTKLPQPLVCMWWDSSYVYDHDRNEMTSPTDIASACTATPDAKKDSA